MIASGCETDGAQRRRPSSSELRAHRSPRVRAEAAVQRDRSVTVPRARPRSRRRGVHRRLAKRGFTVGLALAVYMERSAAQANEPNELREAIPRILPSSRAIVET